jgi:hypothetical protein
MQLSSSRPQKLGQRNPGETKRPTALAVAKGPEHRMRNLIPSRRRKLYIAKLMLLVRSWKNMGFAGQYLQDHYENSLGNSE